MKLAILLSGLAKAKEVCFDELGCFTDDYPFTVGIHRPSRLPDSPDKIDTKFTIHSTLRPRGSQHILEDMIPNVRTFVVIHGWRDNVNGWIQEMTEALLNIDEVVNVVTVDWSKGAGVLDYPQAACNTQLVGRQTALLLGIDFKVSTDQDKMVKTAKLKSAEDVQVIGHSLGGQTAGYAGKFYQTLSGEKVGKLTGLDPAGPFFEVDIPTKDRELIHLYRTDANFVDVIHTTGGPLTELGLGMTTAIGHADFYPNGGISQTGCHQPACSHSRAYKFWTASVLRNCFQAWSCDSYEHFFDGSCEKGVLNSNRLGFQSKKPLLPTSYYLDTTSHKPYCKFGE